ncbi:MAG TPA: PilZ domain-containing protein [Labilithrix sp.]|jgi:hypothetical protein
MDSQERRRDARARISLDTCIVRRGEDQPIEMLDASYRGLLLRVVDPPQLRELVKLRITLPNACELEMHAVVVRVVGAAAEGGMDVGLRFFALNGEERRIWEGFIHEIVNARAKAA